MAERRNWSWDETLVAFRLYCALPFGKLHHTHPEIVALAGRLGRTPSAVSMKACNFASLDPLHQARGVRGLEHRGRLEEEIWERFQADSEAIANEAETAYEQLIAPTPGTPGITASAETSGGGGPEIPGGPSETEQTVKIRRVQGFFRRAVLSSYSNRCALTGLAVPGLLNASHIIPWAASATRRADPSNGLCLNALHDRAFDRGLVTFDERLRLVVSPRLADGDDLGRFAPVLQESAGLALHRPERFGPAAEALRYHREHIFLSA